MVDLIRYVLTLSPQLSGHGGQTLCHIDQQILHGRHVRLFATDAGLGAAGTAGSLLALITEHLVFHTDFLLGDFLGRVYRTG